MFTRNSAWHRLFAPLAGGLLACTCYMLAPAADETEVLPLPAWTPQDHSLLQQQPDAFPLGGLLWPDGFDATNIFPPEAHMPSTPPLMAQDGMPASGEAPRSNILTDRFLLFIPKPARPQELEPKQPKPTPPHALVEVGEEFFKACEALEPNACLLDPHALLAEIQSEDLRRLLLYHAGEASTFAHVLILDATEQLPQDADLSRLLRDRLAQEHTCLAAYPLGEPWRARLFMTHKIADAVAPDYLRGILTACVQDALQASDPVEQLQRFTIQLSIRLIWLERAHPAIFAPNAAASPAPAPSPPATLKDITQSDEPTTTPLAAPLLLHWRKFALIGAGSLAAVVLLGISLLLIRRSLRRRNRRSVWILPDTECQPRLGAPHCGHGGAWIRYG